MGDRPQQILNEQLVRKGDMLIAVFWTRVGSPTGVAASGTIEEIEEFIAAGKPVMVYFSSMPVVPDSIDHDQYKLLTDFKRECQERGLIEEYEDLREFSSLVQRQLQQIVLLNFGRSQDPQQGLSADDPPSLSDDAVRLLCATAEDKNGILFVTEAFGGWQVQTNGTEFALPGDPRSEAHWQEVVSELWQSGLVSGSPHGVMNMTAQGYRVSDSLVPWWRKEGAPRFRLNLAGDRGGTSWLFSASVEQFDGTDIGDFEASWSGFAVTGTQGALKGRAARKWQLPTATIDPERRGDEAAVSIAIRFRWDGRIRHMTWEWRAAADFQKKATEPVFQ